MEQQLQSQIKKNKNLLQSNFTLMQQNQMCILALSQLKKYMALVVGQQKQQEDEQQYNETICADEAQSLVDSVIEYVNTLKSKSKHAYEDSKLQKTQCKKVSITNKKQCQCQKWKSMYINQSEQSLRLSKKLVDVQQKIINIQSRQETERNQIDFILKQYLVLFQRVNSVDFIQSQIIINKKNTKETVKQNTRSNSSKQKRSNSKPKNQNIKSSTKKSSKTVVQLNKICLNTTQNQSIPSTVMDELSQFQSFLTYLSNLRQDYINAMLQCKVLRQQVIDAQIIIKAYREKERQRILYGKFLIQ